MYSRLLTRACERSLYRALTDVRTQVRLGHVAVKKEEETQITSAKFPKFKVIYTLPRINLASSVNRMKRRFTFLIIFALPVVHLLHDAEILSTETAIWTITFGTLLTVWLHSLGIVCNNLIGHMYFHPKDEIVILSYVDYWGKRVDYKTNLANIVHKSDAQFSVTDYLFEKVTFSSQKLSLKILKQGQVHDYPVFRCIVGTMF